MTFGETFYEAATARAALLNRRLNREEIIAVADTCLADHLQTLPKAPQKAGKAPASPFGDRRKVPPTPEQVTAYTASIGYALDGQTFCDFYASKGWVVGKAKMKDWQACCRTWRRSGYNAPATTANASKDYSKL